MSQATGRLLRVQAEAARQQQSAGVADRLLAQANNVFTEIGAHHLVLLG